MDNILPADHWQQQGLEDDNDSSLGEDDDNASSTASLSSSIMAYRTLHGRRYHSERVTDNHAWTPNDDKMSESMDIIHHEHQLISNGKLYYAPIKPDVSKILDIGTGTGMWAIDMADKFPNAQVIGTDISPIQPGWVPPNLKFEIEDCTSPWTYPEETFDFVHIRYLFGTIPNWTALFKEAYRVLKPGGWIESVEPSCVFNADDGSIPDNSAMAQWGKVFVAGGKKFGRPFTVFEEELQQKGMAEAGFIHISHDDYKMPLAPWPKDPKDKEIGMYSQLAIESDIEGYVLFMWSQVMGWTAPEIQVFIAHLRKQLRGKHHGYTYLRRAWAQKPEL